MLLLASYSTGVMEMSRSVGDYRERRFVGLALVAIMVSVPLGGVIPASADSTDTEDHGA